MNKVSVIMPAYNSANYISESIESVIAQTYENWELIIIDDGSVDNTADIVKAFCLRDSRIKYFYQQNGKQGKARNNGISRSSGDFISFLDSDDLWEREKLTIQIDLILEKEVELIFGNCYLFEEDKIILKTDHKKRVYKGREAIEAFIQNNRIAILTVLCKKDIIINVNGFSEHLDIQNAEDYHLWLRLLLSGYTFYSDDQIVAGYRQHAAAVTSTDKNSTLQVFSSLVDISANNPSWNEVINPLLRTRIKDYLFHENLNTKESAAHISRLVRQVKSSSIPSYVFNLAYESLGENIFRKLLLKYL